jgi:2'-5' RNA ligase
VRWIAPETAHLTLHFLGDTASERVELLRLALSAVINRHPSFTLRTGALGVFPDVSRPRVIWLGLRGATDRLDAIYRGVGEALGDLGFEVESGRLNPHLTLGRLRETPSPAVQADIARAIRDQPAGRQPFDMPVTEIQLVRSFLGKGPPRHEPLARYPLGGGHRT